MEKLGLLPAVVGEKKIKREELCVVAWKSKRRWGTVWRLICEGRLVWFVLAESKGGGCSVMVLFSKGAAAWRR
jgi:hypothetical protein